MATTAIWDVHGSLGRIIDYINNPEKTANPAWGPANGERQYFVSGVNCDPATARDAMLLTKRRFNKTEGIVAYHGYQSFAEGEVAPEQAHRMGVELARRIWGDRFEVVVGTHLNTGVIHNHFVLNSVSCVDGKRYYDNKKSYAAMRRASDELCREHQLPVITQCAGRSKHYAEWQAEQSGERTWRSAIREDVDRAIAESMTWQAFLQRLRDAGYEVKASGVKHVAIRPPGKERFVRLRSLGDDYTEDAIRQRILRQRVPTCPPSPMAVTVRRARVQGDFHLSKVTWKSLRALYYFYRRKLADAQGPRSMTTPYAVRADLRHMESISEQAKFLNRYKLDDAGQLESHRATCHEQITFLSEERKKLKNELRRAGASEENEAPSLARITAINGRLKELRKEVRLCDDILIRSIQIKENLALARQQEKEMPVKEKERTEQERHRG